MNRESESDLPDVDKTPSEKQEKPKKPLNRLHVAVAIFTALIIITGFAFKASEKNSAPADKKSGEVEEPVSQPSLNDSVLNDLTKGAAVETSVNSLPNDPRTPGGNGVVQNAVSNNEIKAVLAEVLTDKLSPEAKQLNQKIDRIASYMEVLQEQQSKIVRALNTINNKIGQFEGDATLKLNNVTTELERIRVGVNKIGGEVEKDNNAFKLIVWGRETYAGDVTVSVSTNEAPKNFKSLAVGESLSNWTVKDIRSDEVDFVSKDGKVWTEGL